MEGGGLVPHISGRDIAFVSLCLFGAHVCLCVGCMSFTSTGAVVVSNQPEVNNSQCQVQSSTMAPKRSRASSSTLPDLEDWELDEEEASLENDVESPTCPHGQDDDSSMEDVEVAGSEAEEELMVFLLEQNRQGKLTAKDLCVIAYWCGQAGLTQLKAMGLQPHASSGNFRRHLDSFVAKREGKLNTMDYVVPVPGFNRAGAERQVRDLVCRPPHEVLLSEMQNQSVLEALEGWNPHTELPLPSGCGAHEPEGCSHYSLCALPRCSAIRQQRQHARHHSHKPPE